MIVYTYDDTGAYTGAYTAQESPLEVGTYLTPVNSTGVAPVFNGITEACKFINGAWVVSKLPIAPEVITPAVQIVYEVTSRQIRQALTKVGLRVAVEGAVAASDQDTKDWYEFSNTFERTHPAVLTVSLALGVTTEQLDALWEEAGKL